MKKMDLWNSYLATTKTKKKFADNLLKSKLKKEETNNSKPRGGSSYNRQQSEDDGASTTSNRFQKGAQKLLNVNKVLRRTGSNIEGILKPSSSYKKRDSKFTNRNDVSIGSLNESRFGSRQGGSRVGSRGGSRRGSKDSLDPPTPTSNQSRNKGTYSRRNSDSIIEINEKSKVEEIRGTLKTQRSTSIPLNDPTSFKATGLERPPSSPKYRNRTKGRIEEALKI